MKKINNKGFAGLAIILIIVLGSIGGAGYYVFRKNNAQKPSPSTATDDSQQASDKNISKITPESPAPTDSIIAIPIKNIVKFPEIGVQMTVPQDVGNLIYLVEKQNDPDGKEITYIRLTNSELAKLDANCDANSSALGVLIKGAGELSSVMQNTDIYGSYYAGSVKKEFNGFFVNYARSRASCAASESLSKQQIMLTNLAEEAAKTLELIK